MRRSVKHSERGFTLVEMSIVVLIIGLLIGPAIGLYDLYRTNQRIEQTDFSMRRASDAVGSFLASYGRYPCPASATATAGGLEYGYEDCTAGAAGITTATSLNDTTLAGLDTAVLIGSLPFRTLNLQEKETLDGDGNRMTYAITRILTDKLTYSPELGGISILDGVGQTAVTPEHGAHFVIVAHGDMSDGAVDYTGAVLGSCANAPTQDRENCDNNSVFRTAAKSRDSDDLINYASGIGEDPWQYQNNTRQNIHLKVRSQNLVAGDINLTNQLFTTDADEVSTGLELRNNFDIDSYPETGILSASNINTPVLDENSGAIVTNEVCNTATDCFNPRMIGGNGDASTGLADTTPPHGLNDPFTDTRYGKTYMDSGSTAGVVEGGNIYCDQGVLVGVRDGRAVCADRVTFACPAGQYVGGVDADGRLLCSGHTSSCPAQTTTGFCGGSITIPEANSGTRSPAYSGTCIRVSGFDPAVAATHTTLASLNSYLYSLNNNPANRTQVACPVSSANTATNRDNAMIRETFVCEGTSFDLSSRLVRKRGNYNATWSGNLAQNSNANNSGPAYPASQPMSVDANNTATNHDCWCREDYFAEVAPCPNSGAVLQVHRYRCPNTGNYSNTHNREFIWESGNTHCECVPGAFTRDGEACHLHFGRNSQSMSGNVIDRYIRQCPGFGVERNVPPYDLRYCICPERDDELPSASTDCPAGTGNSFSFEGEDYTNKSYVQHRRWTCPGPGGEGGNVTDASHAGYWTTTSITQNCTCQEGTLSTTSDSCGPLQTGTPPTYETILNCSTNEYTRTGRVIDEGTCRSCSWQPPATSPTGIDINLSATSAYSTCDCNGSVNVLRCKNASGAYWSSCQCRPQQ